ncbi:hypothetical protein HMPREF3188_00402 [Tissierellia bacterium KA00581]|nr:hypothetical protein HMPREF3188_00402 [Tissierellia bacterium KA00581]
MGLSQHRLGKRSGVTRITINRIETENTLLHQRLQMILQMLWMCAYIKYLT